MLKLGLISAATYRPSFKGEDAIRTPGSFHGTAFASTFNGYDEGKSKQWEWTFAASSKRIEKAQVVKIWDTEPQWAERLAEVCHIPDVCPDPESCCADVDGVLIVDDGSGEQWKYALHPLQQGVPTFCDKPLAMTAKQAQSLAALVRKTGTPFMSASSLRFVPDIVALREEVDKLGPIHLATAACGNELVYYGIHALSMYYGILPGGAVSCLNVGQNDRNLVRVRFQDGRDLILIVGETPYMSAGFQINVYGRNGWRTVTPNLDNLYTHLLDRFMRLVETGEESVPVEEEVEVIAILEAGKRSLQESREVTLSEALS